MSMAKPSIPPMQKHNTDTTNLPNPKVILDQDSSLESNIIYLPRILSIDQSAIQPAKTIRCIFITEDATTIQAQRFCDAIL